MVVVKGVRGFLVSSGGDSFFKKDLTSVWDTLIQKYHIHDIAGERLDEAREPETSPLVSGTCPVCFRMIRVRSSKIVLHGYERPGIGYVQGECGGVGYPSFEVSVQGTREYANKLKKEIAEFRGQAQGLRSGGLISFYTSTARGDLPVLVTTSNPKWDVLRGVKIKELEAAISKMTSYLQELEARIDNWLP